MVLILILVWFRLALTHSLRLNQILVRFLTSFSLGLKLSFGLGLGLIFVMVWAMVMVLRFVLVLVKSEYWTVFCLCFD